MNIIKYIILTSLAIVYSGLASANLLVCPNDPTSPVYTEIRQKDSFLLLQVGTIPANIPCDSTQGIIVNNGVYYVVPRDKVTFSGSAKPDVVVAVCVVQ
jgi:hypothetical protein